MTGSRFAVAAVLYALVLAYASTFVGVLGPHFVALDPGEALSRLIHMPYVAHDSNQRSDWMGNVLMLVPLGFLATGGLAQVTRAPALATIGAFVLCFGFILAVKYAQLFFPPRTVTLNYVIAQSLGTAAGVGLFRIIREPLAQIGHGITPLESLRLVLRIYTAALILFLLIPLDFALNLDDLIGQLGRLQDSFTAISGAGRPAVVRAATVAGGILAMLPVGAMLTIVGRGRVYVGRTTGDATWIGFCAMAVVYALSCLLLSGSPSLPAVGFRTAGIAFGAWGMHWLTRQSPDRIRQHLRRLVLWAVPIYLVALAAVNGLLSLDWSTPGDAASRFYGYGLIPLYNYYIVSKPEAVKNVAGHAIMYAPIGVMVWLSAKHEGRAAAVALAASLSALVEACRFFRPGLVADINAVPLAGAAAWGAAAMMPALWRILSAVAIGGLAAVPSPLVEATPALNWRDRNASRRARRRDQGTVIGDVEDY